MYRIFDTRILVAGLILAICLVARTAEPLLQADPQTTGSIGPGAATTPAE